MHVLVSGGTGFVGSHLVKHLKGHQLTVISRSPDKVREMFGEGVKACDYDNLPEGFDAIINLAGASLDKRWTKARKRQILDSRVETTRRLIQAAEQRGAKHFISTSAVGYYGDRGAEELDETSAPGDDFLAEVCKEWEQAAVSEKLRVATVRLGVVLHQSGGMLKVVVPLFRWMLGGRLGNGRQYMPWIHLEDVSGLYRFLLESDHSGVVNGTAPAPVTNREFTRELARGVRRPVSLPVPGFGLRLLYGEMADMLLHGQRVYPKRTQQLGYVFRYTALGEALKNALAG